MNISPSSKVIKIVNALVVLMIAALLIVGTASMGGCETSDSGQADAEVESSDDPEDVEKVVQFDTVVDTATNTGKVYGPELPEDPQGPVAQDDTTEAQ